MSEAARDNQDSASTTRNFIAKFIITTYVVVMVFAIVLVGFRFSNWDDLKEVLKFWYAAHNLLLGAVLGYYFKGK